MLAVSAASYALDFILDFYLDMPRTKGAHLNGIERQSYFITYNEGISRFDLLICLTMYRKNMSIYLSPTFVFVISLCC